MVLNPYGNPKNKVPPNIFINSTSCMGTQKIRKDFKNGALLVKRSLWRAEVDYRIVNQSDSEIALIRAD
jgi:hypothetical protein